MFFNSTLMLFIFIAFTLALPIDLRATSSLEPTAQGRFLQCFISVHAWRSGACIAGGMFVLKHRLVHCAEKGVMGSTNDAQS